MENISEKDSESKEHRRRAILLVGNCQLFVTAKKTRQKGVQIIHNRKRMCKKHQFVVLV